VSQFNHRGEVLPQNTGLDDDAFPPGIAQPVSQAEIEELLYGNGRPAEEREARLREIRDDLRARDSADLGEHEMSALIREIDQAISRLELRGEGMDPSSVDQNPEDHRETLAPDSDERKAIEDADEASVEDDIGEVLSPEEWDEGDDFDPDQGVR
jgi:hypothetical protein